MMTSLLIRSPSDDELTLDWVTFSLVTIKFSRTVDQHILA